MESKWSRSVPALRPRTTATLCHLSCIMGASKPHNTALHMMTPLWRKKGPLVLGGLLSSKGPGNTLQSNLRFAGNPQLEVYKPAQSSTHWPLHAEGLCDHHAPTSRIHDRTNLNDIFPGTWTKDFDQRHMSTSNFQFGPSLFQSELHSFLPIPQVSIDDLGLSCIQKTTNPMD